MWTDICTNQNDDSDNSAFVAVSANLLFFVFSFSALHTLLSGFRLCLAIVCFIHTTAVKRTRFADIGKVDEAIERKKNISWIFLLNIITLFENIGNKIVFYFGKI